MTSQEKEKKKEKDPSPTLMSLPEDLLLSCLARVSRLYYPTLSFVSKRFQSLLASPELYKIRSLVGRTESCFYVCIKSDYNTNPRWFTLRRKPHQTLTNSSGYVLAKVLVPDFPYPCVSALVAVGSSIYNISGYKTISEESSNIKIMDCTSHTWREAPSFPVEPLLISASVLDRNIYVVVRYEDKDGSLKNTFQVLDTKTLIWDPMPFPCIESESHYSAFIEGKFHVKNGEGEVLAYDSEEGKWNRVGGSMGDHMGSKGYCCVIENVLYAVSYRKRELMWYDIEVKEWKNVKGLVNLPKFSSSVDRIRLGGKMMVLWDEKCLCCTRNFISCAEIALLNRKSGEIWGEVEWFDHVLTIHDSEYLIKVIAVTV